MSAGPAQRVRPGDPVAVRWSAPRMTGMGSTAFVGGLVFGLAGWLTGRPELLAIGLTSAVAVVLALSCCPRPGRLTVAVRPRVRTAVGTDFVEEVCLTRTGSRLSPILVVSVRSSLAATVSRAVAPIRPGGVRVVALRRRVLRRGVEPGRALRLAVRDPFGLTRRVGTAVVAGELIARPPRAAVVLPVSLAGEAPDDVIPAQLRAWRPGDDRRRISWRATARTGTPVVAVPDRHEDGPVVVLPTAVPGDPEAAQEAAIARLAAAAGAYAATRPVSLGDGAPTRDPQALADRATRFSQLLDATTAPYGPAVRYAATPAAARVLRDRGLGDRVVAGADPGPVEPAPPPVTMVGLGSRGALWALTAAGLLVGAQTGAVPGGIALLLASVAALASYAAACGWGRDPRRGLDALALVVVLVLGAGTGALLGVDADVGVVLVLLLAAVFPLWTPRARSERLALLVAGLPTLVGAGLGDGLADGRRWLLALAAAALLAALVFGELDRLRAAGLPARTRAEVLRPLSLLVAAAVLVVPLVSPDATTVHTLGGAGAAGQQAGQAGPTRTDGFDGGAVDLSARGELPTAPVWAVPADSPALWRSRVYDYYDGLGWMTSTDEENPPPRRDLHLAPPSDPAAPPGTLTASVQARTDRPGLGIAPGIAQRVRSDAQVFPFPDSAFYLAADRPAYEVTAAPVPTLASARAGTGPDASDPRWLELPPLTARVVALARSLAASSPDRVAYARAVENYLRTHISYDLDSPVPAEGADAVDDLLFVSQRGFCEQFASASVVLLRAAGIPARLVVGFTGGEVEAGVRVLRGSDAHAWAELWVPGTGWVSSDPTAGAAAYEAPFPPREVGLAGLGLLVVGALALLGWRRRPRTPRDPDPLRAAFADLERAAAAAGQPRGPDETVARFARRYGADPEAQWALEVVDRSLFGPVPPDPDLRGRAAEILRTRAGAAVPEAPPTRPVGRVPV